MKLMRGYGARRVALTMSAATPPLFSALNGELEVIVVDEETESWRLAGLDAGVVWAEKAVAETGTVVIASRSESERLVSAEPMVHIALVRVEDIVESLPEIAPLLRDKIQSGFSLTLVSGPSGTSDMEMRHVRGVHGPHHLHILMVGEEA